MGFACQAHRGSISHNSENDDYQQAVRYSNRAREIIEERQQLIPVAAAEWERIKNTESLSVLKNFINKYKGTPSEKLAQNRYDALVKEMENKRLEERQREIAALEREASRAWVPIQNTQDKSVISNFLSKYRETPTGAIAKQRYDALEKYADLQKSLERYKQYRAKSVGKGVLLGTLGLGCLAGSIVCFTNDNTLVKSLGGGGLLGLGLGFAIPGFRGIKTYSSEIRRTESELNQLRTKYQLTLSPAVLPANPFDKSGVAYGFTFRLGF